MLLLSPSSAGCLDAPAATDRAPPALVLDRIWGSSISRRVVGAGLAVLLLMPWACTGKQVSSIVPIRLNSAVSA